MREIKFRAWNTKEKKMFYLSEKIHLHLGGLGGWTFSDSKNLYACSPNDILMEYTGSKDKNGKKIYDGDILTANYRSGYTKNVDFIIIGNIYENQELLNKNQGKITND